ncbi:unnamed protein product [Schistocephalus solidus]|uniref:Anaphase-promoting complex subunit 13 n=1 Tax=Schistocephalus solidus TaxID=70667 RepID=A0A183TDQ5_SCHSO|nr:unnamed protein product [Schistocephalus solidus]
MCYSEILSFRADPRMNRGRRRGGVSSGFSSLRDGVKRRLFDPHTVPVSPDPRSVISRLILIPSAPPKIDSSFPLVESQTVAAEPTRQECFRAQMFELQAIADFIFENGPDFHQVAKKADDLPFLTLNRKRPKAKRDTPRNITISHLLLQHREMEIWRDGILLGSFSNPTDWYPAELTSRLKTKPTKLLLEKRLKPLTGSNRNREDLDNLVSDQAIADVTTINGVNWSSLNSLNCLIDDEAAEGPDAGLDLEGEEGGDNDSEDARWNGEQIEDEDEDLDNDYCETYFDNGEGDIDDGNVLRDDNGDGVEGYYD